MFHVKQKNELVWTFIQDPKDFSPQPGGGVVVGADWAAKSVPVKEYQEICLSNGCEHYIAWTYKDEVGVVHTCESCQLVGETHRIDQYPDACPYIDEMRAKDVRIENCDDYEGDI